MSTLKWFSVDPISLNRLCTTFASWLLIGSSGGWAAQPIRGDHQKKKKKQTKKKEKETRGETPRFRMRNRTAFGVFDETLLSTLPSTSERMNEKRPTWWLWAQPIASRRRRSRRGRTAADNRVGNCNCAASLSAETQTDPLALDLSGQKKNKTKRDQFFRETHGWCRRRNRPSRSPSDKIPPSSQRRLSSSFKAKPLVHYSFSSCRSKKLVKRYRQRCIDRDTGLGIDTDKALDIDMYVVTESLSLQI